MSPIQIIPLVILPPLGVYLQDGMGRQFWINLLLTLLGYVPGMVHAVWVVTNRYHART